MRLVTRLLRGLGAAALLWTSADGALAQETGHVTGAEHEHHRYAVAGFIGGTRVDSDNELTLGIEGGLHLNSKWSIGAVLERADRERDSTLVLLGVGWHPIGPALRLQLGLGRKDPRGTTETVLRTGVAYEMEIENGWFVKPYLAIDFIHNEDNEGVFGLYIGRGF